MSSALAAQAATRAVLAGIAGIGRVHDHTGLFRLVPGAPPNQPPLPLGEPAAKRLAPDLALLRLPYVQVFEDQHG
ncbi:hypothetical protein, partial [Pyrinomonas sp.]|uniref:hypothetical protein n=1 Tax=Pyrinomonas sp. TaxID=2080306 RepID=UPI0033187AF4